MSHELEFVVADPADAAWRSPLRRALSSAPDGISDVTPEVTAAVASALGPAAGLAGIEILGPKAGRLLTRLTEIDLDALPAVGAVAEVRALVERVSEQRYRIWFGQELADYVVAVVLDAAEGLGWE
jgi:sarcosine oxidase gamma subunit